MGDVGGNDEEWEFELRRAEIGATPLFQDIDARSLAHLASESELVKVSRGHVILHEDGESDCIFIVVQGSLEVFSERAGGTRVLDVLGDGASIGEMGALTREPRTSSVRARRDSTLVRIPAAVFETVLRQNAEVTLRLARTLSDRLKRTSSAAERPAPRTSIALLRACDETLFDEFNRLLTEAFDRAGDRVALVSPSALGLDARDSAAADEDTPFAADGPLAAAVATLERAHDYVLCACDLHAAGWSRWSIRQADRLLVVGRLTTAADVEAWPAELEALAPAIAAAVKNGTRVELALVRPSGVMPAGTAAWLAKTSFSAHHQLSNDADDHDRLVRRLSGRAWGLVLGGGGARGFAHIGAIRALLEGGLPIDMIGGTSMGAILAAQYAMGCDPTQMLAMTRRAYVNGSATQDLTLPCVSLRTGRATFRTLKSMFGDRAIEDLPTPYFCVSCNLTRAAPVVHDRGPVWFWARVSSAVPGLVPPVPYGGELLVDGGLLDNLPVGVMRQRLGGSVAASDVSVAVDLTVDESLVPEAPWSGSRHLFRKFTARPRLPNIVDVLMRTAEIGSVRDSQVSGIPADLYLRVPVEGISMTDFKAIDRIVALGYEYTARRLDEHRARVERDRHQ